MYLNFLPWQFSGKQSMTTEQIVFTIEELTTFYNIIPKEKPVGNSSSNVGIYNTATTLTVIHS